MQLERCSFRNQVICLDPGQDLTLNKSPEASMSVVPSPPKKLIDIIFGN